MIIGEFLARQKVIDETKPLLRTFVHGDGNCTVEFHDRRWLKPTPSCCDRLTLRVVLLKVSPLVARLISVPDDLSLEELHDVLQLVFGWSGQAFYNFRIHGQEIGRQIFELLQDLVGLRVRYPTVLLDMGDALLRGCLESAGSRA